LVDNGARWQCCKNKAHRNARLIHPTWYAVPVGWISEAQSTNNDAGGLRRTLIVLQEQSPS